jgi:molybdenum cofactor biosynthesis enzyme MoaA
MKAELVSHVAQMVEAEGDRLRGVTFSGGEPLVHPRLEEYVARFRDLAEERTVVTNGLLLDRRRLDSLLAAGVTRFRIGVDSFTQSRSRPSLTFPASARVESVVELLSQERVRFDINVVLSAFNRDEIPMLLQKCRMHRVSVKFFEYVAVDATSGDLGFETSHAAPRFSQEEFWYRCRLVFPDLHWRPCPILGEANVVAEADGFMIRYCRYLCEFGMCHYTGTRIDPRGMVYACLSEKGGHLIQAGEPLAKSLTAVQAALVAGCWDSAGELARACG